MGVYTHSIKSIVLLDWQMVSNKKVSFLGANGSVHSIKSLVWLDWQMVGVGCVDSDGFLTRNAHWTGLQFL